MRGCQLIIRLFLDGFSSYLVTMYFLVYLSQKNVRFKMFAFFALSYHFENKVWLFIFNFLSSDNISHMLSKYVQNMVIIFCTNDHFNDFLKIIEMHQNVIDLYLMTFIRFSAKNIYIYIYLCVFLHFPGLVDLSIGSRTYCEL